MTTKNERKLSDSIYMRVLRSLTNA